MTGDPADVGRAPVNVAIVIVEDILVCERGIDEITARRMQHALRLPRRPRGIEDEEWILGAHLLGRTVGIDLGHLLVEPDVAALRPWHLAPGAAHHEDTLHAGHFL